MKRALCLIFAFLVLSTIAFAESYPPATSAPDKEYDYDDYFNLILHEDDFLPDNICQTIWAITENSIGEEDSVKEVSLVDGALSIKVDLSNALPEPFTEGMYAQDRASSIMDSIFSYPELDAVWASVHLVFPHAEAVFTPDMAQGSGTMRYIDAMDIIAQIPD